MAILYIRNVDEKTMAVLRDQAKRRNTNPTELGRMILNRYAANPELMSIDDKYRSFAEDVMELYQMNMEELKQMVQRNVELAEKSELLLMRLDCILQDQ